MAKPTADEPPDKFTLASLIYKEGRQQAYSPYLMAQHLIASKISVRNFTSDVEKFEKEARVRVEKSPDSCMDALRSLDPRPNGNSQAAAKGEICKLLRAACAILDDEEKSREN